MNTPTAELLSSALDENAELHRKLWQLRLQLAEMEARNTSLADERDELKRNATLRAA